MTTEELKNFKTENVEVRAIIPNGVGEDDTCVVYIKDENKKVVMDRKCLEEIVEEHLAKQLNKEKYLIEDSPVSQKHIDSYNEIAEQHQKNGMLKAIKFAGVKGHQSAVLCKCDCGNETIITTSDFKREHIKSCGCMKTGVKMKVSGENMHEYINRYNKKMMINFDYETVKKEYDFAPTNREKFELIKGKKFGKLTIVDYCSETGSMHVDCKCDCGGVVHNYPMFALWAGNKSSCGCARKSFLKGSHGRHVDMNKIYGDYKPIEIVPTPAKRKDEYWKCECVHCGKEKIVANMVLTERNPQCLDCKIERDKQKRQEWAINNEEKPKAISINHIEPEEKSDEVFDNIVLLNKKAYDFVLEDEIGTASKSKTFLTDDGLISVEVRIKKSLRPKMNEINKQESAPVETDKAWDDF